jgi:hypothetical protein
MASVYELTIAGVAKDFQPSNFSISRSQNAIGTFTFDILSLDGTYRPALRDKVIYKEDGVRKFTGYIDTPGEAGLGGKGVTPIITTCTAVDLNVLIDRRAINLDIPAGTLKSVLLVLAPYLSIYGLSLDPAQVDGPLLERQHYYFTTLKRAFELLYEQTDYVVEIDDDEVWRMKLPVGTPAPISITEANGKAEGDIEVEDTDDDYANRILILGGAGLLGVTEDFVADGSTDTITLNYTLAISAGYVSYGGNNETLGPVGDTDAPTWEWQTTGGTTTIRRVDGNPTGAVQIPYTAHFPKLVVAGDDPPLWTYPTLVERILYYPDVFSHVVLQKLADKMVARTSLNRKRVTLRTREENLKPGMTITLTFPKRNVSGTYTITDIHTSRSNGNRLIREITFLEGDTFLGESWEKDVASWGKDMNAAGGQAVMTAGTGTPSLLTVGPEKAVQYAKNAMLKGSPKFTYDDATQVLMVGEGNSVNTADPFHIFIFGEGCSVED